MTNFKQILDAAIEKQAAKCGNAFENEDSFYFKQGAKLPSELLILAIEALENCEMYPNGYSNMKVKAALEQIKTKLKGAT